MAATIKDIAKIAGVSTATVSRVINNLDGYSKEVETKVLAIAKELGYRKNENAISLVKKSTKLIGVVMPDVATSFYGKIINGIEDMASEEGYGVILTHAGVEGKKIGGSLNLMAERRVDGIIIVSILLSEAEIEQLNKLAIPTILLSTKSTDEKIPYIKVDDYAASKAAVNYLISCGHERIGLAGVNPEDPISGKPRISGYVDAISEAELRVDYNLIKYGDFSFESGKEAMDYYLKMDQLPDAVFCVSDETALGIISACYENKIVIPDDISVIGYDNSRISSMSTPPISTIAQPFYTMGSLGCQKLIHSLHEEEKVASQIVEFELIERKSVQFKK
ncbi:LacI family DNA-binding transcriptional regulator [Carnobacterium gallinarum]|uniref:LacI family DNA-binding transcriptional regulator n=1 Tax=Carnobacterium gallinarum TaxID=2749 RepID=UPI000550B882|nr:LacI family DNA-binding transcriptional regulator [Carnobacterium gallinarum]